MDGRTVLDPANATFSARGTYGGELVTPVTLNRYTYAANNPLRYFDPDGRRTIASTSMSTETREQRAASVAYANGDDVGQAVANQISKGVPQRRKAIQLQPLVFEPGTELSEIELLARNVAVFGPERARSAANELLAALRIERLRHRSAPARSGGVKRRDLCFDAGGPCMAGAHALTADNNISKVRSLNDGLRGATAAFVRDQRSADHWTRIFKKGHDHLVRVKQRPGFHWGNHQNRIEWSRHHGWHYNPPSGTHEPVRTGVKEAARSGAAATREVAKVGAASLITTLLHNARRMGFFIMPAGTMDMIQPYETPIF